MCAILAPWPPFLLCIFLCGASKEYLFPTRCDCSSVFISLREFCSLNRFFISFRSGPIGRVDDGIRRSPFKAVANQEDLGGGSLRIEGIATVLQGWLADSRRSSLI